MQGTNIFSIIGMIVVALVVFPIVLKVVFGFLGIAIGLFGLAINALVLGGILYVIYRGFLMLKGA